VARTDVLAAAAARNCAGIARALCAAQGGCAQITDIARLARLSAPDVIARLGADFLDLGDNALAPAADLAGLKADMMHCLAQYHADHPLHGHAPAAVCLPQRVHPALVAHVVQSLSDAGVIHRPEGGFALAGHDPLTRMTDQQRARMAGIEDSCRAAGLSPAPAAPEGSEDAALTALSVSAGRLLVLRNVGLGQELLLHREAVGQAAHILHTEYGPAPFTTSQARDTLHTSRRVIVPLLEHFDTTGTTVRSGDLRRMASAYPVSTGALPR
jgi:selenocysteine-specific elongation factor